MSEKDYREHFEDELINHEMIRKSLSYLDARKELIAWKKQNKEEYQNQFEEYIDEVKGY